jgi:hypothetical protein
MADVSSSLPIRSQDDVDSRVLVKIQDFASPDGVGNQVAVSGTHLFTRLFGLDPAAAPVAYRLSELGNSNSDGFYSATDNTLPSSNGLIGHTRAATPGAADQVIRTTAASPTGDGLVAANIHALDVSSFMHGYNGATWDRILSTGGALNVNAAVDLDGVYDVGTNPNPDSTGSIFHSRAAAPDITNQIFRATGGAANADNVTPANVHGLDVNSFLMGYDATGANWDRAQLFAGKLGMALFDEDGAAFSSSNPLPVTWVDSEGTEINVLNTGTAIAGGATSNHDYTVTAATTLKLSRVYASASGKMKIEVSVETGVGTNTFTSRFVQFNSTANPNIDVEINENITVAAGVRVRVARTNLENQAQNLYSTISGHEI